MIGQYYNAGKHQMEIPIYTGYNYISFCSLVNSDLNTTFCGFPTLNDVVRRYINGVGWQTAEYFGDVWMWWESYGEVVNPIETGVGYEYYRAGSDTLWVYPCDFIYNGNVGLDASTGRVITTTGHKQYFSI